MHHILHNFSFVIHRSVILKFVRCVNSLSRSQTLMYTYESLEQDYTEFDCLLVQI